MQERRLETRQRILTAALQCFSQSGYDSTSVDDICQAAGKSKGAFFYNFPSKQAVFLALLDQWLETIDAMMAASLQKAHSAPEALRQMAEAMTDVFGQAQGRLPMFLEFWTQASHDPLVWQSLMQPFQRYQAFFRQLVEAGVNEGSFRQVDPEITAHTIISLALGLLLQGALDPQGVQWDQITKQAIDLLLKSIEKDQK